MSIEAENIIVPQDVQEHFIIKDREIIPNPNPKFDNNILVTYDNKSNRLYFNMYHTFDDRNLNDKAISIVWINANNERGTTVAEDVNFIEERLTFSWNVPVEATYKAGTIYFAVHITTTNYVWNSLAGTVEVRKGLITEEFNELSDAEYPSGWLDYIEGSDPINIRKLTQTEYDSIETKSNSVLYLVITEDNNVFQYLGETLVSGGGASSNTEDGGLTLANTGNVLGGRTFDYNRTTDNYRVYYRQNTEDAPLELEYESLTADEISITPLSKVGYYYIFSLTPFQLDIGRYTLTWMAGYTTSSSMNCKPQYIFCESSEFPTNLQPEDVLSSDLSGSPHDPPVNVNGSGNYQGNTVNNTSFTGVGDSAIARNSGYLFWGCVLDKKHTGDVYVLKNTVPQSTSEVSLQVYAKKLQYNNEDIPLELPVSNLIMYDTAGNLSSRAQQSYSNNIVSSYYSKSLTPLATDTYGVYTNKSSDNNIVNAIVIRQKNLGLTKTELSNMPLTFTEDVDYYIVCETPIDITEDTMIMACLSATYTVDSDGVDIQPFILACRQPYTSLGSTVLSQEDWYFGETKHVSTRLYGTFSSATCACGNFISWSTGSNTNKVAYIGVRIRKTGTCTSVTVQRDTYTNGYMYYRAIKLNKYLLPDSTSTTQRYIPIIDKDLQDMNSTPFLAWHHDGVNHLSYHGTIINLNSLFMFLPPLQGRMMQSSSTPSLSSFTYRTVLPYTYDVSELDSGSYYIGLRTTVFSVDSVSYQRGLVMFSKVVVVYEGSNKPDVSEFSTLSDNEIVFYHNAVTNTSYECTNKYVQLSSYLFGKFTWDKSSQIISNFDRIFVGKLIHPTVAYTQFLIDCSKESIISQFTEKINALENKLSELTTQLTALQTASAPLTVQQNIPQEELTESNQNIDIE